MGTVGDRLKQLRNEKNMTMQNLADALGLNNSSIVSKWERGERNPKDSALQAYANYFDVSKDWIINGNEDDAPTIRNKLKEMENAMDFILDYLTTLDRRQDLILQEINELKEMMKSAPSEKFKE